MLDSVCLAISQLNTGITSRNSAFDFAQSDLTEFISRRYLDEKLIVNGILAVFQSYQVDRRMRIKVLYNGIPFTVEKKSTFSRNRAPATSINHIFSNRVPVQH